MTKCDNCYHRKVCKMFANKFLIMPLRRVINGCKHYKADSDVAEVKHGKWIAVKENGPYGEFVAGYRCSCCNGDADWSENWYADVIYFTGAYCSNCGAIMDGRDIEDDL